MITGRREGREIPAPKARIAVTVAADPFLDRFLGLISSNAPNPRSSSVIHPPSGCSDKLGGHDTQPGSDVLPCAPHHVQCA
jgi:hypothetical protein